MGRLLFEGSSRRNRGRGRGQERAEKILILKGLTSRDQLLAKRFSITAAGSAHLLK
jgi:hypothetical protein